MLESVLHALAAFDVVCLDAEERFSLSDLGALLLPSSPGLPDEAGVFFETIYRPLGGLVEAVKTGEIAFDRVFGCTFYEYLARNPGVGGFFSDQMVRNAPLRYAGISSVFDFSGVSRIVDVGGGQGGLILRLLNDQPHLTAAIVDLPEVIEGARQRINEAGLSRRCEFIPADFLDSVPAGGDVYILAFVVNNCRDQDAARLFANCRASMGAKSKLLILESLREPGKTLSRWAALVELGIVAQRGGKSRTEGQLRRLLRSAGLNVSEIRRFPSAPRTVIEVAPI
jgi:hypothetical protein